MIPIRLELRNFLAYRDADPLDFTGLRMVCLTGENGAGKSSLLDAITWALWGQARARRDDELIAQGETEARVSLTFSEGEQTFQVVRTRKVGRATQKGRAPTTSGTLDFFIEDSGSWRALTEPRVAETQARIERLLNLSYETFINSAYLKQGRADEFTLRSPAERKAVLAEILSLDFWAEAEERVKTRQAAVERDRQLKAVEFERTEAEIARAPDYERDLAAASEVEAAARVAMERSEAEVNEFQRVRAQAAAVRGQIGQARDRLAATQADRDRLEQESRAQTRALAEAETALAQREDILRGVAALEAARTENETLNLKLVSLTELNARKTAAETALADARRALESARDAAEARLATLESEAAAIERLGTQLLDVNDAVTLLNADAARREALQRDLSDARERQGGSRAENEALKRDMNDLAGRIRALETVGATCPTCGRELAEIDRVRLLAEWRAQGKRQGDTFRANQTAIQQLSEHVGAVEASLGSLAQAAQRLPALQREASAIEERLARASQAADRIPAARLERDGLRERLSGQAYAPDARAALADVVEELRALGYDNAAHAALRARLAGLQAWAERKSQLDRAEVGAQAARHALDAIGLRREGVEARAQQESAHLDGLTQESRGLEDRLKAAPQAEAALQRSRSAFFAAQRKMGEAQQRLAACRAMTAARDRLQIELDSLANEESLLRELREAFGKNGVPAMIIESALPELENSANALLARMSNGRMNVRFETQRATQSGDARETLEIRISDELGERPYELFSGGESFRVNFAVRIALSRMLAHRAGARLQTLFIDEGFGTQDAQGRERLIEAIKTIEPDFERVIVITHIDELRDAFPARIEVTKTQRGSVARVV